MKRVGGLWDQVVRFSYLWDCAWTAARGKRRRPDVAWFLHNAEFEVARLQRELARGTYHPGGYRMFAVRDPKPRLISAAAFRDRVVHHALSGVMEPVFERRFSPCSFACRTGLGTHAAIDAARRAAGRFRYALKLDVRKYFASIDHAILEQQLARVVKCKPTLDLAARIIAGSNRVDSAGVLPAREPCDFYFPGDDLFTPYERQRGLPLGNQTSQFFANVYLDPLDQFVTRQLRPGAYMRYVDELLLFDDNPADLERAREVMADFAAGLRLLFHGRKTRMQPVADGVAFLGWRIFPGHARLRRDNVVRFMRRARWMHREHAAGLLPWDEVKQRVASWIGHARHGDTWRLREDLLSQLPFVRANEPAKQRKR